MSINRDWHHEYKVLFSEIDHLLTELADFMYDNAHHMTCGEVDTFNEFCQFVNFAKLGQQVLEQHGWHDEEDDRHYTG